MAKKNMTSDGSSTRKQGKSEIDRKRRSIAKVGLTAPVLMTLASRPALARQCSTSAWNSGNMSNPVELSTCGPCTNRQWVVKAKPTDWKYCLGNQDPTMIKLGDILDIPVVQVGPVTESVIDGDIANALQGNCVISGGVNYYRQNSPVDRSIGDKMLRDTVSVSIAMILNILHPTTSINLDMNLQTFINRVNSALTPDNDRIDLDELDQLKQECENLMLDGSSCALS